jgi:methionyl-tRNA formyltransferase
MTYDPMLDKKMGTIDFSDDANMVRGRINGLNPWPCATVPISGERIRLLRAVCSDLNGKAGTVLQSDTRNGLIIACGKNAVRILELQAPGGKPMKAEDYLRGHQIPAGISVKEDPT